MGSTRDAALSRGDSPSSLRGGSPSALTGSSRSSSRAAVASPSVMSSRASAVETTVGTVASAIAACAELSKTVGTAMSIEQLGGTPEVIAEAVQQAIT